MVTTPKAVLDAIDTLSPSDKDLVLAYVKKLESTIAEHGISVEEATEMDTSSPEETGETARDVDMSSDEPEFPPLYSSGEDFDKAADYKSEASELMAEGKWEEALEKFTQAVLAAEPSPLLYANRANVLLQLHRPRAAERDCTEALKINPDSAKALRIRGKARKALGLWEQALHDLSESQTIDFDEATVEDLKVCSDKMHDISVEKAKKRLEEEEKLKKRAAEIKRRQEEAKHVDDDDDDDDEEEGMPYTASSSRDAGGMPDLGGAGGMPGMGGSMPAGMAGIMQAIMSDPELAAALQNPKVMAAFSKLMSEPGGAMGLMANPAKMQELMSDPDVGPVLQKLLTKLGPAMGGGAPGGFGAGAPSGFGGAPSAGDDVPNLDEIPDLD